MTGLHVVCNAVGILLFLVSTGCRDQPNCCCYVVNFFVFVFILAKTTVYTFELQITFIHDNY